MTVQPYRHGAASTDGERRAGSYAASFASDNALPLLLIGLGVSWLLLGVRGRRLIDAGPQTTERAQPNPLLLGAVAVGAGVGVGLSLPSSRREDELLGRARARVRERVRRFYDETRQSDEEPQR